MGKPTTSLPADSTVADVRQRADEVRKELTVLRVKARRGGLEQPHRIQQLRREIARLQTPGSRGGTPPSGVQSGTTS